MSIDYHNCPEKELVERVIQGDNEAWEKLIRCSRDMIKGIAQRRGYEHPDDLISDLYDHLKGDDGQWEKLKTYRRDSHFSHWVSSVALNLAEEKQRKPRAVKEREVTEADLSEQQKAILQARGESTPYVDPSRSVERGELHVILNEAISELRDKECQLLLREVYFRGEKAADVARCMGITPNAANVKKSRNLEQLERILREKWPDYPWDDL